MNDVFAPAFPGRGPTSTSKAVSVPRRDMRLARCNCVSVVVIGKPVDYTTGGDQGWLARWPYHVSTQSLLIARGGTGLPLACGKMPSWTNFRVELAFRPASESFLFAPESAFPAVRHAGGRASFSAACSSVRQGITLLNCHPDRRRATVARRSGGICGSWRGEIAFRCLQTAGPSTSLGMTKFAGFAAKAALTTPYGKTLKKRSIRVILRSLRLFLVATKLVVLDHELNLG